MEQLRTRQQVLPCSTCSAAYKKGMPSQLIKKIFSQINSGLKVMIENAKYHLDLKPSNKIFYILLLMKKKLIL